MLCLRSPRWRAWLGIALTLLALLLLATLAPPPVSAAFQTLPVQTLLNPDGTINLSTGASGALDLRGWKVTLDSMRGPILAPDTTPPDKPLVAWSALSNQGFKSTVYALAVSGRNLFVGGFFNKTDDGAVSNLNKIALLYDAFPSCATLPGTPTTLLPPPTAHSSSCARSPSTGPMPHAPTNTGSSSNKAPPQDPRCSKRAA